MGSQPHSVSKVYWRVRSPGVTLAAMPQKPEEGRHPEPGRETLAFCNGLLEPSSDRSNKRKMFIGSNCSITKQGRETWIWSGKAINEHLATALFAIAPNEK